MAPPRALNAFSPLYLLPTAAVYPASFASRVSLARITVRPAGREDATAKGCAIGISLLLWLHATCLVAGVGLLNAHKTGA